MSIPHVLVNAFRSFNFPVHLQQAEAEYAAKVVAELEADEEEDEDKLIEERRRRRAEIQRKHQEQERLAGAWTAPHVPAVHAFCRLVSQDHGELQ